MGASLERHPSYVSLSGLFLHVLERVPKVGDTVPWLDVAGGDPGAPARGQGAAVIDLTWRGCSRGPAHLRAPSALNDTNCSPSQSAAY